MHGEAFQNLKRCTAKMSPKIEGNSFNSRIPKKSQKELILSWCRTSSYRLEWWVT